MHLIGLVDCETVNGAGWSLLLPNSHPDKRVQSPSDSIPTHHVDSISVSSASANQSVTNSTSDKIPPNKRRPTADSVARFLHQTPGLDKSLVGDYLAEPPDSHPFNTKVRAAYVARFDFRGMTFDGALRMFLSGFRLPGEAQKIDRLMEAFAGRLYEQIKDSRDDNPETRKWQWRFHARVSCMKCRKLFLCFASHDHAKY